MTRPSITVRFRLAAFVLAFIPFASQGASGDAAERATAKVFDSIRADPGLAIAFLRRMPKGGDLHNHISGAIYAESYVGWAAEDGLCYDARSLALAGCDADHPDVKGALAADGKLYGRLVDAWSMRNREPAGQSGHEQYFDAFAKFRAAAGNRLPDMAAEVATHSAGEGLIYLELMLTPDNRRSRDLGKHVGWQENLAVGRRNLLDYRPAEPGDPATVADVVANSRAGLDAMEKRQREIMACGQPAAAAGCGVVTRYIFQISRTLSPAEVYAQMIVAMELARTDSRFVGLNLGQPEDAPAALANFRPQMRMLDFLHRIYPEVHISLHAGEFAPGLTPPEAQRFHIAESVRTGHAERIGHGVDILYEDNPYRLLREMAERRVLVEVCLSSNDDILGVRGKNHPLKTYLAYGVPTALATDNAGIARSDISREFLKAAEDIGVDYGDLKRMARASLEYAFVEGRSLWRDGGDYQPVAACAGKASGWQASATPAAACQAVLDSSVKARLQWRLEQDLAEFERIYSRCSGKTACP